MVEDLRLVVDKDVATFLENTSRLLYRREAEYGLMLGLAEGFKAVPSERPSVYPICLRSEDRFGVTRAAYFQTRSYNGIVTHLERGDAELFALHLAAAGVEINGIVGPSASAETFAEEYTFAVGRSFTMGMAQKILKLEAVNAPRECSGRYRLAGINDVNLAAEWYHAFSQEVTPGETQDLEAYRAAMEQRIPVGGVHLWEVDGCLVSITHTSRPTRNGISVGMVYTPPSERGRGYASNLVAAVSQKMLDAGKQFCVLYTDATNPTSNKIYQEVGYKLLSDSAHYLFGERR